ncbi:sugar transferase [Glaciecola sp. SC05]|uniref:sugar transferase n=1 Tax=Glaciecola sp. SC05 TaxID=1987355 RepID=UPI003528FC28
MKRVFDIVAATFTLLALLPILAIVGLTVRLKLGAPIFFKQSRPGLHGKSFQMLKFRSMYDESNAQGQSLPDSKRLGRFGRLLRSTSLDELPGLINVIRGDMSLVGPRPLLVEYLTLYSEEQARRHEVRPGITGWAQVNGRNAISWDDKFKLDVWYVDNWSFSLDLKILYLTVKKVFKREGISASGEATISKFTGSEEK